MLIERRYCWRPWHTERGVQRVFARAVSDRRAGGVEVDAAQGRGPKASLRPTRDTASGAQLWSGSGIGEGAHQRIVHGPLHHLQRARRVRREHPSVLIKPLAYCQLLACARRTECRAQHAPEERACVVGGLAPRVSATAQFEHTAAAPTEQQPRQTRDAGATSYPLCVLCRLAHAERAGLVGERAQARAVLDGARVCARSEPARAPGLANVRGEHVDHF